MPHEGEKIEVVEVPLAELFDMARQGAIEDAKTLILVQRLMLEEAERGLTSNCAVRRRLENETNRPLAR